MLSIFRFSYYYLYNIMQGPSFRTIKQIKHLIANPIDGVTLQQDYDNFRHFVITIDGPTNTCYEGGKFKLQILLRPDYPMRPPEIAFDTKIYHPNIDQLGRIKLKILEDAQWTPIVQIRHIVIAVKQLMINPNINQPYNQFTGQHWATHPQDALQKARQYTLKYAQ